MKLKQLDIGYQVSFERSELFPDVLVDLAKQMNWKSGSITGLGAANNVILAYYDLTERTYLKIPVIGVVELVSLTGNLSYLNNTPFWHLHATVGDRDGNLKGGHLISFEVAITVECIIVPSQTFVQRAFNEEIGLNLLNL